MRTNDDNFEITRHGKTTGVLTKIKSLSSFAKIGVVKYSADEARDDDGRFASGDAPKADDSTYVKANSKDDPEKWSKQILKQLANGEHPYVKPSEVATLLKQVSKSGDKRAATADITNLRVNGTRLMGHDGLGYKRSEMPQISGDMRHQYFADLRAQGITVTPSTANPLLLQPSQSEIGVGRAAEVYKELNGKIDDQKQILVSRDNYIIDGHHHWASAVATALRANGPQEIPIVRLGASGEDMVRISKQWADDHGLKSRALGKFFAPRRYEYQVANPLAKYNEDQARDDDGRFASGSNLHGYALNVAQRVVAEAQMHVAKITADVTAAIKAGDGERARMTSPQGKDTTVKSPERLAQKFVEPLNSTNRLSKAGIAMQTLHAGDVVRYTGVYNPSTMTEGIGRTISSLQATGYEPVKIKNYFNSDPQNGFRGINSVWEDKTSGVKFELQFHTQDSIDAADKWHGIYEEIRQLPMTSEAYQSTRTAMLAGFAQVPMPPGIESVGTRSVKKRIKIGRLAHKDDIINI